MDLKKIGCFLKKLRKEKHITQEQLAEILGVSSRTVSRWETGYNMPDLSILIQIAEYYQVDIKEILNGERKSEVMDNELKDTLLKVADYNELEKEQALKAGNTAFLLMFGICTLAIIFQMLLTFHLKEVAGETIAMIFGGIAYIIIMVHNGIWDTHSKTKNSPLPDAIISILCAAIFSVLYALCLLKMGASETKSIQIALIFFIGIAIIGFTILRLLAYFSKKKRLKNSK